MGISPLQMDVDQLIRTPPGQDGRLLGHVAAMLGLFGTCDMLLEPQEGQRFAHLDGYHALKGPTSPFRGLTP
jgi:hypothetical protein